MSKFITLGTVKVPIENYATQANAILGIKGSGKTEGAKGIAEQLLDNDIPIVVFDPSGVWRYLKVPKHSGGKAYKIVVAGGQAADLPLTPHTAPEILRSAMRANIPLVIDLFDMKLSKNDWRQIVERCMSILLYENKGMRHVFLEEAAEFCPQFTKDSISYAAVEKLVRMGGNSSVGITLINQRAQEVNKAVLELCELLVLQRQKGSHAMAAIEKWVTMAEDFKNVAKTIAAFGAGEALVWPEASAPIHTQFPRCVTFHPDRKKPELPKGAMPENVLSFVDTMKESLVTIEAEMKANDPAELKKQIVALKAQVKKMESNPVTKPVEVEKIIEVPVLDEKNIAVVQDLTTRVYGLASHLDNLLARFATREGHGYAWKPKPQVATGNRSSKTLVPSAKQWKKESHQVNRNYAKTLTAVHGDELKTTGSLPKGEATILTAIAQHGGCSREQLTVLTGYKRSSRDTYLQRLGEKGFVDAGSNGQILATDDGLAALPPDFEHLPTGDALREHWIQRLPQGERIILEVLIAAYPEWIDRDAISAETNYQRSSRDTYLQRLAARMLIETDRGTVRASSILFGE